MRLLRTTAGLCALAMTIGGIVPAASMLASAQEAERDRIKVIDPALFDAVAPEACQQWPLRVFARSTYGTECVEFYATAIPEAVPVAVFNFHGDFVDEVMSSPNGGRAIMGRLNRMADAAAKQYGMPFINISRPGILQSTGDHLQRRQHKEYASMSAAIDMIKERYGIEKIALAGQSGGGSIVAGLLALGRTDIVCAAPGSGAFDLDTLAEMRAALSGTPRSEANRQLYKTRYFSPSQHIDKIATDTGRRIFVIGDPRDSNTFFVQQREYAERLKAAGHHVVLHYAPASDERHHGVTQFAIDVAGMCAGGKSDAEIDDAFTAWWRTAIRRPPSRAKMTPSPAVDRMPTAGTIPLLHGIRGR
jgi:hypothetical protein